MRGKRERKSIVKKKLWIKTYKDGLRKIFGAPDWWINTETAKAFKKWFRVLTPIETMADFVNEIGGLKSSYRRWING